MNAMSMDRTDSSTARRYLALWFPFLPIDRLRIARPDLWAAQSDAPAVVVENVRGAMRLATLDADALAAGLTAGMTLADARAREPELRVFEADPHGDQDWLERLCDGCARYTPNAALDSGHGLMLDISGCAHLWDGEAELAQAATDRLERHGMRVRHAIAGSPEAAHALARFPAAPAPDEDAAVRRPVGTLLRVVRAVGCVLSVWMPAYFLALAEHHAGQLSGEVLSVVLSSHVMVFLPMPVEMIFLLLVFQLVRCKVVSAVSASGQAIVR